MKGQFTMTHIYPRTVQSRRRFLPALAAALVGGALLVGCDSGSGGPKVTTDYAPNTNFAQYHTYAFQPGRIMTKFGANDPNNTLLNNRIQDAVAEALPAKGLTATTQNPDLVVTYIAGAQNKKEIEDLGPQVYNGPYFGQGFFFRPYGAWWDTGFDRYYVNNYTQGTLILDFVDPRTKQLVWRAYVSNKINSNGPVDQKAVDAAVNAALKQYTPKAKGK